MLPFIREHFSEPVVKLSQWRQIEYPTAVQPKNHHIKCPSAKSHGKTYSKICVCFSVVSALQQILLESPLGLLGSLNQWLYSSNFQGYSHPAFRLFPLFQVQFFPSPSLTLFFLPGDCWQRFRSLLYRASLSLSLFLSCVVIGMGAQGKKQREILVLASERGGPSMPVDPVSQET